MEMTLDTVMEAARQRLAAVTAEVAGYLVLLVADAVSEPPRRFASRSVWLDARGHVRVAEDGPATAQAVESELRQLLAALLSLSASPTPALRAAADRGATGDLEALRAELLAALVPINHAAAERALARLWRETSRAGVLPGGLRPGGSPSAPSAHDAAAPSTAPASTHVVEVATASELDIEVDVDFDDGSTVAASRASVEDGRVECPAAPLVTGMERATVELAQASTPEVTASELRSAAAAPDGGALVTPPLPGRHALHWPAGEGAAGGAPRSDVGELIGDFLSHTRSRAHVSEELRRMVGIGVGRSDVDRHEPAGVLVVSAGDAELSAG